MLDLFKELQTIIQILDREKIPYALVGGLAYSILVETRATEDIDILIFPLDWQKIQSLMETTGYVSLSEPMDFKHIKIRRLTKFEGSNVLVLDFLFAEGKFMEGIHRAIKINYQNQEYCIAPPDIIMEMKKGRMSNKDKNDIEGLKKLLEGKS